MTEVDSSATSSPQVRILCLCNRDKVQRLPSSQQAAVFAWSSLSLSLKSSSSSSSPLSPTSSASKLHSLETDVRADRARGHCRGRNQSQRTSCRRSPVNVFVFPIYWENVAKNAIKSLFSGAVDKMIKSMGFQRNTDRLRKWREGGHIQGFWIDELHLVSQTMIISTHCPHRSTLHNPAPKYGHSPINLRFFYAAPIYSGTIYINIGMNTTDTS